MGRRMVSKNDIVYIHVPKTGGKSIYIGCGLKRPFEINEKALGKHSTAAHYVQSNNYKPNQILISSVRNPWERIASLYNYLQAVGTCPRNMTFQQFLYNPPAGGHYVDVYDRNQLQVQTYANDIDGNSLIDYWIRLEHQEEDIQSINDKIGTQLTYQRHRSGWDGKGVTYKSMYTYETYEYIKTLCEWEIDFFGYNWDFS